MSPRRRPSISTAMLGVGGPSHSRKQHRAWVDCPRPGFLWPCHAHAHRAAPLQWGEGAGAVQQGPVFGILCSTKIHRRNMAKSRVPTSHVTKKAHWRGETPAIEQPHFIKHVFLTQTGREDIISESRTVLALKVSGPVDRHRRARMHAHSSQALNILVPGPSPFGNQWHGGRLSRASNGIQLLTAPYHPHVPGRLVQLRPSGPSPAK